MTKILPPSSHNLELAADLLQKGELIVIPTETVYGLAASIHSESALHKIYTLKKRPYSDPLIVHVSNLNQARRYALWDEHPALLLLAETFWPGPLTILLPRNALIPSIVTAGQPTVAMRCPDHPVALDLLQRCPAPLAAPSANRFGKISPTTPEAVLQEFGENCPPILDGGHCRVGIESTIVGMDPADPQTLKIFRPGLITATQIQTTTGLPVTLPSCSTQTTNHPLTPGSLPAHYCPNKPVFLLPEHWRQLEPQRLQELIQEMLSNQASPNPKSWGWLLLRGPAIGLQGVVCNINPNDDLTQAAALLYSSLRYFDNDPQVRVILVELAPPQGIGIAINDRLLRASRGSSVWSRGDSNP